VQVYHNEVIITEPTAPGHYLYGERVSPGRLLVVRNVAVTWSEMTVTESGQFFIFDGARKIFISAGVPSVTGGLASWNGIIYVGEGDRPGVYCPDSVEDDEIHFFISGELLPLLKFRG